MWFSFKQGSASICPSARRATFREFALILAVVGTGVRTDTVVDWRIIHWDGSHPPAERGSSRMASIHHLRLHIRVHDLNAGSGGRIAGQDRPVRIVTSHCLVVPKISAV